MFRRSGTVAAFLVEGRTPDPGAPEFCEKLADQRFRGIERAASEDESVGWVTAADPTGARFTLDDIDMEGAVWLRLRFDRKRLPSIWLKIHLAEAERAQGRKLKAAERKDLKAELMEKLLPGQLPSVQMVDILYDHRNRKVLAFGASTRISDALVNLFHRTFGATLVPAGPGTWADAIGLDREQRDYLQRATPVRWPRGDDQESNGRRQLPEAGQEADPRGVRAAVDAATQEAEG